MATTHRPARLPQHHARRDPISEVRAASGNDEYYRKDYIEFINRLMQRMKIDALREMVDVAMDKADTKEG